MKIIGTVALASLTLLTSCATASRPAAEPPDNAGRALAANRTAAVTGPTYSGDVDGDGRVDRVALATGGRLLVQRAVGGQIAAGLPPGSKLVGLSDLGVSLAIVTSTPAADGSRGRIWAVRTVDGDGLRRVATRDHELIGSEPGFQVSWVTDSRALFTGSLDPLERGQDRRSVETRRWRLVDGRLTATPRGTFCWDLATDPAPRRCHDGDLQRPDVGPRSDLPALFPADKETTIGLGQTVRDGHDAFSLRRATPPGSDDEPNVDLVERVDGTLTRVGVPAGWSPVLFRHQVNLGSSDAPAVLTSQEGGDSDTWRVWAWTDGHLAALPTRGPIALGGGFAADGNHATLSWMASDGRLYTRVGTDTEGRYDVYAWRLDGAGSTLVAHRLGTVCLDLYATPVRYGTC